MATNLSKTGTKLDDELNGGGGFDTLRGAGGDDVLVGGGNNDLLFGGADNDRLRGETGADTLDGGDGKDTLDGGSGIDSMIGGKGGDTYLLDSISDVIVEFAEDNGIDTVKASFGYTLPPEIENLVLTVGSTGTGNASDNRLTGSSAGDILDGGGGADTVLGGGGNDKIYSSSGGDTLDGGAGADGFVFDMHGYGSVPVIKGFESGADKLSFDTKVVYGALPRPVGDGLHDSNPWGDWIADDQGFYAAPDATAAHDADDRLIYNMTDGHLYYDGDGTGENAAVLVAILDGAPALAATDINTFSTNVSHPT